MNPYLKYGISAIALLSALPLAQAEERQGAERGAPAQHQSTVEKSNTARTEKGAKQTPANEEERGKAQTRNQTGRTAKNAPAEEQKDQSRQREGRGGGQRVSINVSGAQKTRLHDAAVHDTAIHVYHRGDVHFDAAVGTRIPEGIEFYAPPPEFVEIDPAFQGYMIVVLDDEILVIDPATREIVDVIPI